MAGRVSRDGQDDAGDAGLALCAGRPAHGRDLLAAQAAGRDPRAFDERAGAYLDLVERLRAVDLLHIDDVGAEKTSEWVLEQLYDLVNARYENQRSTVLTTNLDRDRLAEQITERTVSRLEETCGVLELYGADARRGRGRALTAVDDRDLPR